MQKFKKVRTWSEVKKDPRVHDAYIEGCGTGDLFDGQNYSYFVSLNDGWKLSTGGTLIHERSVKNICHALNYSVLEDTNHSS